MRVGLCEDDAELRSVLSRALRAEGFDVRATATGRDAVARFSGDPPDVLVLDIGLPDSDGRDVCQALRAHGVEAPVLFLTARGALTDRLAGFGAGGDDYLHQAVRPRGAAGPRARAWTREPRAAPSLRSPAACNSTPPPTHFAPATAPCR